MEVAAAGGIDTTPDSPGPGSGVTRHAFAARLLACSPELVAVAVAGFSLGPMILLLAGHFTVAPVLVTGVLGAAAAIRVRGLDAELPDRRTLRYTGGAAALVLAWVLANLGFTGQNVYATRDPATYNITARWLMDNASLHIYTHPEIFGSPAGACDRVALLGPCIGGAGFSPVNRHEVYSQGNHLMPAIGAVGGWLFGVPGLFATNLVLGGLALFVFYGLVRRVASAPLALLAMAALAVTMPMIYVSRDTYSEPLMMLFLMGALGLLHRAINTGRVRDYGLAGFVGGCSAMVRIDSYGALLAILLVAIVIVGLAASGGRRAALQRAAILLVATMVPTVVGWLDLTRLSYGYYRDVRHNVLLEQQAALALLVLGALAVAVVWRPRMRQWLSADRIRDRISGGAISALVAVFLLLASRPLWLVGHQSKRNPTLENWQRESGVAVDGTRSYVEQTLSIIAAYVGWATVVLAVVGYALLLHALIRRRDYALTGVLGMGLSMSALYIWNWEITPDQPWAMRRYVPVVLPLLLLAAVVGLRRCYRLGRSGELGRFGRLPERGRRIVRGVVVLAGIAMVAFPAAITAPMATVREEVPQYAQVQALCAAIGSDGAVVEIDAPALNQYGQTMRSYCGVPSMGVLGATPAQLVQLNAAVSAHQRRLFVMWQPPSRPALAPGSATAPFSSVVVQRWPDVIGRPPTKKGGRLTVIYLATVSADGRLVPVPPR